MQVLLVLIDANERVVTRDELIASCWRGLIVGDDAISRVISRIRRLSEGAAAGSFSVETVPKVGYRLLRKPGPAIDPAPAPSRQRSPQVIARRGSAALVLLVVATIATVEAMGGGETEQLRRNTGRNTESVAIAAGNPARDPETRGRAALFDGSPDQLRRSILYLQEATTQAPDSAGAWGALALAYARATKELPPAPGEPSTAMQARDAARRALALDSANGDALGALVSLEPTHGNWLRKDFHLQRAMLTAGPDSPAVLVQRARFLAHVGRTSEALTVADRVARHHPLVSWVQRGRMTLLAATGRWDEAERLALSTGELWPRDHGLWHDRLYLYVLHGRTAKAKAMLEEAAEQPDGAPPHNAELLARAVAAVASGDSIEADRIVAFYRDRVKLDRAHPVHAIQIAAALGRLDDAMAIAEAVYLGPAAHRIGEHNVAPLFVPPGDRLWSHPRFMPLVEKMGLADYWRRTAPPDFCRSPSMTALCVRHGLLADEKRPLLGIASQAMPKRQDRAAP